ncbi:MAG: sugar transferase [Candidatus Pacebacteria bacterium]|nr:sugar transferase [Candidatus Paceibacterota bacterium]
MNSTRKILLFSGDCLALIVSFLVMLFIDQGGLPSSEVFYIHAGPFAILFLISIFMLFILDLYEISFAKTNPLTIGRTGIAFLISLVLGAILFYTIPYFGITPKLNLFIFTVIGFVLVVNWRRTFSKLFANTFIRRIAIIGKTPETELLEKEISKHPYIGTCVGFFENIGNVLDKNIDMIVVAVPATNELVIGSSAIGKEIIRVSEAYEEIFSKTPLNLMNNETALEIIEKSKSKTSFIVLRFIEIVLASIVLLVTLPFMIIAILAIIIENGFPIFYNQERVGKNGKIFKIHKLRTMRKDAEKSGATWALQNDPRVTKVGYVLRKLHIDEIPQMINIIKGDIALVGPRPERPEFVSELEQTIPYYFLRHIVRPGFTGWAQIKYRYARSVLDSKEKFEYDLFYLKRKNFLLDVGIVVKTIQIIFTH